MNGNFDYDTNPNDSTEELIPFWEQYELDYILETEIRWYNAMMSDDMAWRWWGDSINRELREAETVLARYGIKPNLEQLYNKFNTIHVYA